MNIDIIADDIPNYPRKVVTLKYAGEPDADSVTPNTVTDNDPTDRQRAGWKRRSGECGVESEQERSRKSRGEAPSGKARLHWRYKGARL